MKLSEYADTIVRTIAPNYSPPITKPQVEMFHAALGLATEAGELLDNWKKAIFYGGRVFDTVNADEEMGDLMWYMMLYCKARAEQERCEPDEMFQRIMAGNTAKLRARYPGKFETQHAEQRDTDAEIAAMQRAMRAE